MTILRGPADADHYRVKQGRYNDRFYTDPLPSCPIAEASDKTHPSWSIVKGAAGKDWSYTANKRNGHTSPKELFRIAGLDDPDERTKAYNGINKKGLKQAQGRGQIVHLWAEDLLAGHSPRLITEPALFTLKLPKAALDEALTYLPALTAFFDHYQPEVIAAEYVALHRDLNGHGYGCTPDVIARIQGQTLGIDWKSRGVDSDHGAYPEEAAQIAAGANAQYIIITAPKDHYAFAGQPIRARLPRIDGGIVVSIRPDGCRIYPIDLTPAWSHVQAMHAFWVARLTEKTAIGKPWAPIALNGPHSTPTPISDAARIPASDATGVWARTPVAQPDQQEEPWTSASNTPSKPSKPSKPTSPTTTKPTTTTSTGTTRGTNKDTPAKPSTAQANASSHPTTTPSPAGSTTTPSSTSNGPADDLAFTSSLLAEAMTGWPAKVTAELEEWWPILTPTPDAVRRGEAVWTEAQIDHIGHMCDLADAPFWQTAAPVTARTR